MLTPPVRASSRRRGSPATLRETLAEAAGYWEWSRLWYNVALALLTIGWVIVTWPAFRHALTPGSLGKLALLAGLANVGYCAAYLVEIAASRSVTWPRRRGALWLAGTLFS